MTVLTAGRSRQEVERTNIATEDGTSDLYGATQRRRGSVEVWERHRLTARSADAAMQRILHHDGVDDLVGARPVQAHDKRPELRVLAAGTAPAEAARPEGGLLTGPAVHAPHLGRRW
jgi:hypothetical protein